MNRHLHTRHSPLTRRRFLACQSMALGGAVLGRWLPAQRLLASTGNSNAGAVTFPLKVSENRRYRVDSQGKPR